MKDADEFRNSYVSYDGVWIHLRPDGAFISDELSVPIAAGNRNRMVSKKTADGQIRQSSFLNRSASRIARYMDGQHTVDDIVRTVLEELDASREHGDSICDFIKAEVAKDLATLHPSPRQADLRLTGSTEHYHPVQIAIEMTHRCNCACRHCYLEAGGERERPGELSGDAIIGMLSELIDRGACAFEVTGGEALMHPDFWDVYEYLASQKVLTVVLTNGLLVTEEVAERLGAIESGGIQVSLDGPTAEVHDYLRQQPGCFDAATRAIRLFAEKTDLSVRVAMSIYRRNFDLLEETVQLARELGATQFVSQPVTNNGRAFEEGDRLALAPLEAWCAYESVNALFEEHGPEFFGHKPPKHASLVLTRYLGNCGMASMSVAIDPYGEVRPCLMSPPALGFGNLIRESYDEVFSRSGRLAKLPYLGGVECSECPSIPTCGSCVLKGIEAYCRMREKGFETCRWGKVHKVSELLDELGWDMGAFATAGCTSTVCAGQEGFAL
ncbi:MAG: radical SAM protein [Candidatus Hydrogenedentes bacterium]|nr:radical SAM protein [Candidatus Hydrogenedentota bacterium]